MKNKINLNKKQKLKKIIIFSLFFLYIIIFSLSVSKPKYIENNINLSNFIKEKRKIKMNDKIIVKKDGFYLFPQYYNGKINDKFDDLNEGIAKLKNSNSISYSGKNGILKMGDNDSLIFLYNNNNKDGITIDNFKETISFYDTAALITEKLKKEFPWIEIRKKGNPNSGAKIHFQGTKEKKFLGNWITQAWECHTKKTFKKDYEKQLEEIKKIIPFLMKK